LAARAPTIRTKSAAQNQEWAAQLERGLRLAEERDAIQAERPSGCWCLGLGGDGDLAIPDPAGGDYIPGFHRYCDCPEGVAASERARAAQVVWDRVQAERKLARLIQTSGVPDPLRGATFENFRVSPANRAIWESVRDYAEEGEGSALLWGDYGVGKSWLAAATCRVWVARSDQPALFVLAADLMDAIRDTFNHEAGGATTSEVLRAVREAPFLVLDDLGTEGANDWVKEQLFKILYARLGSSRRTLITTNHDPRKELARHIGPRAMERVIEMCGGLDGRIWPVLGPNHRHEKGKS
jgi:DNA replication protein DnaC